MALNVVFKRFDDALNRALKLFSSLRRREGTPDEVVEIAKILANIMVVGMRKRCQCAYYRIEDGTCTKLVLETPVPTLVTVERDGKYFVVVDKHPEICAVCPYWRSSSSR